MFVLYTHVLLLVVGVVHVCALRARTHDNITSHVVTLLRSVHRRRRAVVLWLNLFPGSAAEAEHHVGCYQRYRKEERDEPGNTVTAFKTALPEQLCEHCIRKVHAKHHRVNQ